MNIAHLSALRSSLVLATLWSAFCPLALSGDEVSLTWDPNTDSEDVAGYRVHYGKAPGFYPHSFDAGNNTAATIPGLIEGRKYFFVVTAYNSFATESLPSQRVSNDGAFNKAPTIVLSSLNSDAVFVEPAVVRLQAHVSDSDGTVASVKFHTADQSGYFLGLATSEPFVFNWTGLLQGSHSIVARAFDNEGAVSTSEVYHVNVAPSQSRHLILLEAEDGEFPPDGASRPLVKRQSEEASEGRFVTSETTNHLGSVRFTFDEPTRALSALWFRVRTPLPPNDSFRVAINDSWSVHHVYGTPDPPENSYSNTWFWSRFEPRMPFAEAAGATHSVAFGNLETDVWIDRLIVTSDRNFEPSDSVPSGGDFVAITTQPQNQQFAHGTPAIFSVTAVATGPISYQWMKDDVPVPNATSADVFLDTVQYADHGSYTVVATSGSASAVSEAGVLFIEVPELTVNSLRLNEGETVAVTPELMYAIGGASPSEELVLIVSELTGGQFLAGGVAVESFSQRAVAAGTVTFVHDGTNQSPSYLVSVSDGRQISEPQEVAIQFTAVNDMPRISLNVLELNEGEWVLLTSQMLRATDEETAAEELAFAVTSVTGGGFFKAGNEPVTTFTQAEVASGEVIFVHDGSNAAPAYEVSVIDENQLSSQTDSVAVSFSPVNDPPELIANSLAVTQGTIVTITEQDIDAIDEESEDDSLWITVVDVVAGEFHVKGFPNRNFSLQQVHSGEVEFRHDGTKTPPAYSVTLSDGEQSTGPQPAAVAFAKLPIIEKVEIVSVAGIQLTIIGDAGQEFRLEYSSDLQSWTLHSQLVNFDGALVVAAPTSLERGERFRFYRLAVNTE